MALTILSVAYPLSPVAPDTAGGAEQIILQLDRALVDAGHRSLVIACEGSEIAGELLPVPKLRGAFDDRSKTLAQYRHARTIRDAIGQYEIDVVHLHGIDFHTYLPPAGIPVLATLHLPLSWYPQDALYPSRRGTWLHCVSSAQHETKPRTAFFLPPIENGVGIKSTPGRGEGGFALFLGRICPEKGVHLAIEAAKRADVPLIIAGTVYPYPEHLDYFRREIEPHLDSERRFIGCVGPAVKEELLASARCLVVPSLVEETSSLVAREALAAATPVIAFPRAALAGLIEHGRTGLLVNDLDGMADAFRAAGTLDRHACFETAQKRFPLSRMIEAYFTLYTELAARAKAICTTGAA